MTTRQRRIALGLFVAYVLYGAAWLLQSGYRTPAVIAGFIALGSLTLASYITEDDVNE